MKLELQKCKLDLIRDGKLSSESGVEVAHCCRAAPVISVSKSQCSNVGPALTANSVSSGLVSTALGPDAEVDVRAPDDPVVSSKLKNSETLRDLGSLLSHLTEFQRSELAELIRSYPTLFGDITHTPHRA